MDSFLRRVVAQRELEQEVAILATPVEAFVRRCRVCGRQMGGEASQEIRVCTECGGLKHHLRLRARDHLLKLAGINPNPGVTTMSDRNCSKCGKNLRSNNAGDDCWSCRKGGDGESKEVAPTTRRPSKDALKRFKVVANALGADPDKLISDFAEGWLEQVKRSVHQG